MLLLHIYPALPNLVKNNHDALALPSPGQQLGPMPSLSQLLSHQVLGVSLKVTYQLKLAV